MAIKEKWIQTAGNRGVNISYLVTEAATLDNAVQQLKDGTSATVTIVGKTLQRDDIRADLIRSVKGTTWHGEVSYKAQEKQTVIDQIENPVDTQDSQESFDDQVVGTFDTRGRTKRIFKAISQTKSLGAPDVGNAIDVQPGEAPRGVVVPDNGMNVNRTCKLSSMTSETEDLIDSMRGKVNSEPVTLLAKAREAGTVQFLGASGSKKSDGSYDLTFFFKVDDDGFVYPWDRYELTESEGRTVRTAEHEYNATLFAEADLTTLPCFWQDAT